MTKKTTKKDYINMLLAMAEVQENKECVDFLLHELELLDNRKTKGKKAKEKTAEQEALMEDIHHFLLCNPETQFTATEIMKKVFKDRDDISVQKVTAMLKKLFDTGVIDKVIEKKVSYFSIADAGDEVEDENDGDVPDTGEEIVAAD